MASVAACARRRLGRVCRAYGEGRQRRKVFKAPRSPFHFDQEGVSMVYMIGGSYEGHIVGHWLSTDTITEVACPTFTEKAHDGCIRAVTSCGKLLVTCGADHTICTYNLQTLRSQGTLLQQGGGSSVCCLTFHHDSHLLSGSGDGEMCIWRTSDWECLMRMKGHRGAVHAVAIHPSGRAALSVAADANMMLWNLTTGKNNYTSPLPEAARLVAWSPDGESYAHESPAAIMVYGLRTGALTQTLRHEGSPALAIGFLTPQLLISGGESGSLRVWCIRSGQCTREHDAHARRVKALAMLHPKASSGCLASQRFASASSDGTMTMWELEGAAETAEVSGGVTLQKALSRKKPAKHAAWSGRQAPALALETASAVPMVLRALVTINTRLRLTALCVEEWARGTTLPCAAVRSELLRSDSGTNKCVSRP